jgi:protein TonB
VSKAPEVPSLSSGKIDTATQERLARQEAAARLIEKNVLEPSPPKAPAPPQAAAAVTAPPVAAPSAVPKPSPVTPTSAAPQGTAAPAKAPSPAPKPEEAKPTPSAPAPATPRTDVASARPAPTSAPAPALRLVTRVDPEFPREALQAGVDQGTVKARMTLDASGGVTRVEILDSNPRRVFDRAVSRALSQWRYSEGAAGRTVEMEVAFKR